MLSFIRTEHAGLHGSNIQNWDTQEYVVSFTFLHFLEIKLLIDFE